MNFKPTAWEELWCIVCIIDVSVQRGCAGAENEREKTAAIRAHTLRE